MCNLIKGHFMCNHYDNNSFMLKVRELTKVFNRFKFNGKVIFWDDDENGYPYGVKVNPWMNFYSSILKENAIDIHFWIHFKQVDDELIKNLKQLGEKLNTKIKANIWNEQSGKDHFIVLRDIEEHAEFVRDTIYEFIDELGSEYEYIQIEPEDIVEIEILPIKKNLMVSVSEIYNSYWKVFNNIKIPKEFFRFIKIIKKANDLIPAASNLQNGMNVTIKYIIPILDESTGKVLKGYDIQLHSGVVDFIMSDMIMLTDNFSIDFENVLEIQIIEQHGGNI